MKKVIEHWQEITAIAGLLGLVIGVLWYFVGIEGRINRLEAQLLALQISPVVTRRDGSGDAETAEEIANPLWQACADLALRVADARRDGRSLTVAGPLEELMKDMGCMARNRN